jgi:Flp pilus assembly pilin Flp
LVSILDESLTQPECFRPQARDSGEQHERRSSAVKSFLMKMWHDEDGVLSFEWTLLTSLLTVGVVSGITAVRDSTVDEFGDLSQAMLCLDQSYFVDAPLVIGVHDYAFGITTSPSTAASSRFVDAMAYGDCSRGYGGKVRVQEFNWRATGPAGPVDPVEAAPAAPAPQ